LAVLKFIKIRDLLQFLKLVKCEFSNYEDMTSRPNRTANAVQIIVWNIRS